MVTTVTITVVIVSITFVNLLGQKSRTLSHILGTTTTPPNDGYCCRVPSVDNPRLLTHKIRGRLPVFSDRSPNPFTHHQDDDPPSHRQSPSKGFLHREFETLLTRTRDLRYQHHRHSCLAIFKTFLNNYDFNLLRVRNNNLLFHSRSFYIRHYKQRKYIRLIIVVVFLSRYRVIPYF